MSRDGVARAGVCLVRVEVDSHAGLLITVTIKMDADSDDVVVANCTGVRAALGRVREFLEAFE